MKFQSSRLRDTCYKIDNLTLDQARQNGEIVRLGDSQLLIATRNITNHYFDQTELNNLIKKSRKKKSFDTLEKIDKMLFIPDLVTIEFTDSRHYKSLIGRGGLQLNGKIYQRLLSGAGMSRRSTVLFCNTEIIEPLREFLNCGRNPEYKKEPSKFSAYYALASSSTWQVSSPKFVVIPDCEIERYTTVDFLHESVDKNKDPVVSPENLLLKYNLFDGQGLICPKKAQEWSDELCMDYTPSAMIFRNAFAKGLLVTFDFHKFATMQKLYKITDIYGQDHNVEDIEVILSLSQFKLWDAYENTESYIQKCNDNNFSWGISRSTPKYEKNHAFSTYQYLQNLNITTQEQIAGLCKNTIEWFDKILGDSWVYTILFLLGELSENIVETPGWFDNLNNPLLQSLLLQPKLINDKKIQTKVQRLLAKKIKESYLGVLLLHGNYQMMISDPYAQAEHALGLEPKGLLKNEEHFSQYWNKNNETKVAALRSPLTYRSEINILNLQNNNIMQDWYKYQNSGIIFNIHGTDCLRMSGADL